MACTRFGRTGRSTGFLLLALKKAFSDDRSVKQHDAVLESSRRIGTLFRTCFSSGTIRTVSVQRIVYNWYMKSRVILCSVLLVAYLAISSDVVACPTCKDGLAAADSEGANIARGYFYSILLMMAMPFTLAGSFGLYVWRETRRQRQANDGDGKGEIISATGKPYARDESSERSHETPMSTAAT